MPVVACSAEKFSVTIGNHALHFDRETGKRLPDACGCFVGRYGYAVAEQPS